MQKNLGKCTYLCKYYEPKSIFTIAKRLQLKSYMQIWACIRPIRKYGDIGFFLRSMICNKSNNFGYAHTVTSQDFRSFCFLSVFLSKIVQLKFFCEITTYTSRLLSFDKSFSNMVLIIDFNSNFLLEAGQILERSQWIQIL